MIAVCLLLAQIAAAAPAASPPVERFAIVIGQNLSDDPTVVSLRYADDDALASYRLFTEAGIQTSLLVMMDSDTARLNPDVAPDGPPTLEALRAAVAGLVAKMRARRAPGAARVEFLLFYSGHGGVDGGEGYIVLQGGRLSRSALYAEVLDRSPADTNHVIIDACKSYYMALAKGPGGKRSPYLFQFADRPGRAARDNTGFTLSSSSDRDSHEWERYQAGIFSHEVRSAMRGGADVERDGRITYAELGAFLATANARIDNPRFRPDFYVDPPGERESGLGREIFAWPAAGGVLVVDRTDLGHVYLEDARGERLLDLPPGAGDSFLLHLPLTRPLFVRRADDSEEVALPEAADLRLADLTPVPASVIRKGALHLAFENLFEEPFSPAKVAEYRTLAVREPVPLVEVYQAAPSTRSLVRETAFWSTIGLTALGAAANFWALGVSQSVDAETSHADGVAANETIGRLNTAAIVLYSLAGAAAVTWLVAYLGDSPTGAGPTFSLVPVAAPRGAGVQAGVGFEW